MSVRSVALAFALALTAAACSGPKDGDPCGSPECGDDPKVAYFCEDGHFKRIDCKGPAGCFVQGNSDEVLFTCDVSNDQAGDSCPSSRGGFVICKSAHEAIVCKNEIFKKRTCADECVSGSNEDNGSCVEP